MSDGRDIERRLPDLTAALEALAQASQRTAFALLDLRLDLTPLEDRPTISWEVEREQFMRGLTTDPREEGI